MIATPQKNTLPLMEKRTATVGLRLKESQDNTLLQIAAQTGASKSQLISYAIDFMLDLYNADPESFRLPLPVKGVFADLKRLLDDDDLHRNRLKVAEEGVSYMTEADRAAMRAALDRVDASEKGAPD